MKRDWAPFKFWLRTGRVPANMVLAFSLVAVFGGFGLYGVLSCWGCRAPRAPAAVLAAPPVSIHYAPAENLEAFDVALIARAQTSIDVAAYVLTDYPVIEALGAAAKRGVRIRILLDRSQHARREEVPPLAALRALPNVTIRLKATDLYMHMKSYTVDGRWLRAGAANFSASGLKKQDNERIEFDSPALAAAWARNFEVIFGEGVAE